MIVAIDLIRNGTLKGFQNLDHKPLKNVIRNYFYIYIYILVKKYFGNFN